jgi:UDP-glucuronate 4-epimerase
MTANNITDTVLVTGVAGFIGYHTARRLLESGVHVCGIDNLNAYYEVSLKAARLGQLLRMPGFHFHKVDIADRIDVGNLFRDESPTRVVHLAAQAGVRYSLQNPHVFAESNLVGFVNILEGCRHTAVRHLVYASSSSVYGGNTKLPFSVTDSVDHPISLYAATKKANELMAHAYSHLFQLQTTGLRFFTVYGPWGRPDMAPFLFTKAILSGQPIDVFNYGRMKRDFTYIDDIVEGVIRVLDRPPNTIPPFKVYNIGNHIPVDIIRFIEVLEDCLGKKTGRNFLPIQPGDVPETCSDIADLERDIGFRPDTPIETGIARFVTWYRAYYG